MTRVPDRSALSSAPEETVFRFRPFVLDTTCGRLYLDGEPVHLRPQAYALLRVLVEGAPALMSKDELLDAVWGVEHISPSTLKQTMSELRSALDDDPRNPRYIETVQAVTNDLEARRSLPAAPVRRILGVRHRTER
jgi:DNA-binding winged helix-turn-helix (wHTH) protein